MNILALESSTEIVSAALLNSSGLKTWEGRADELRRQGNLLCIVADLCCELGLGVRELDCIAFGQGPGAFTGLRTACSLSLGLAEALALPVVTVSSLRALALAVAAPRICVLLDARMDEIYWALFERDPSGLRQIAPVLCSAAEDIVLPEGLWTLVGNACVAAGDIVRDRNPGRCAEVLADRAPRAGDIAEEALREILAGRSLDPGDAELLYVRDKVALTTRERLALKASS